MVAYTAIVVRVWNQCGDFKKKTLEVFLGDAAILVARVASGIRVGGCSDFTLQRI